MGGVKARHVLKVVDVGSSGARGATAMGGRGIAVGLLLGSSILAEDIGGVGPVVEGPCRGLDPSARQRRRRRAAVPGGCGRTGGRDRSLQARSAVRANLAGGLRPRLRAESGSALGPPV